jgi:hypothetical protein
MGTIELKSNIHKIVDGIENEQLLKTLYDFLKIRDTNKSGHWASLTEEQKQEVLLAYDESEDETNLVARENVFKRTK